MKHALCYTLVLSIVLPLAVLQARSASFSADVSALKAQVVLAKENEKAAKKRYDAAAKADKKLQKDQADMAERGGSLPQEELDESTATVKRTEKEWQDAQSARQEKEAALERAQRKLL